MNSLLTPGLTPDLCWSPKQQVNLTPVQRHWLVQGGMPIPVLDNNERVRLRNAAIVIFGNDPLNPLFYSANAFSLAVQMVIEHAGIQCFTVTEELDGLEGSQLYFSFDRDLLRESTSSLLHPVGLDIDPNVAFQRLRALSGGHQYTQEVQRRTVNGIPCDILDHMAEWYLSGVKVVDRTGFRVPYAKAGPSLSPLQRMMKWLDLLPARLAILDTWAADLAKSAAISELECRSEFSFHSTVMDLASIKLRTEGALQLFGLTVAAFKTFQTVVWPTLAIPLFRRARELKSISRGITNSVHEAIWFGKPPIGPLSAPMNDLEAQAGLVALNTLKEERKTLGELLGVEARSRRRPGQEAVRQELEALIAESDLKMQAREQDILAMLNVIGGHWEAWIQANQLMVTPALRSSPGDAAISIVRPAWTTGELEQADDRDREEAQRRLRELGDEGREEAELNGEDFINENEDGEGWELLALEIQVDRILQDPCPWPLVDSPPAEDAMRDWLAACNQDADNIATGHTSDLLMSTISAIFGLLTNQAMAIPLLQQYNYVEADGVTFAVTDDLYARPVHVGAFGHQLYESNLAAICFIRYSPDNAEYWHDLEWDPLAARLAASLALLLHSDRPWLYVPMAGFAVDHASRTLDDIGLNDKPILLLYAIREYVNGCVMAATVGARSYNSATSSDSVSRRANVFRWSKDVIYMNATFGLWGSGPLGQNHCWGCVTRPRVRHASHSYRVDDRLSRLSVSTTAIRRGIRLDCTTGLGRFEFYPCVALLYSLAYHPTFVYSFMYFADIIHQEEKVGVVKSTVFFTANGPTLGS